MFGAKYIVIVPSSLIRGATARNVCAGNACGFVDWMTVPFETVVVVMKMNVVIELVTDAGWLLSVRMIGALTTRPRPSVSSARRRALILPEDQLTKIGSLFRANAPGRVPANTLPR